MIHAAGDAAVVLELDCRLDPVVNARALDIAAVVRGRRLPGVRDVVPAFASVTVHVDPLSGVLGTVAGVLAEVVRAGPVSSGTAVAGTASSAALRVVEVPVAYGGEYGPDLGAVAAAVGLAPSEVARRHAAVTYRVYMLGFAPGFPYLGAADPSIAVPRHATPRLCVPAGSVALADRQTGIYPEDGPGGWHLVGRTDLRLFDTRREQPALLMPGEYVRFVPVASVGPVPPRAATPGDCPASTARTLTVLRPGWLTTVQDLGRWGHQHLGVPVSGAMDGWAHRAANRLVGNPDGAATLELTVVGPELRCEADVLLAVCGADLAATLDGRTMAPGVPMRARAGSVFACGARRTGTRAYLACAGGVQVPEVLGSRATHLDSRLGGLAGQALRAGDRLSIGPDPGGASGRPARDLAGLMGWTAAHDGARLRVLPGPQAASAPDRLARLLGPRLRVSPHANRMGYRLDGAMAPAGVSVPMLSTGTVPGGVQMTGAGAPVLLMADRQTTGGYPQVAAVIAADLPRAAQLGPGDWIEFVPCTPAEAHAALLAGEDALAAL